MSRLLRILVLLSAAAALALGTALGARGWGPLDWWVAGAVVAGLFAGRFAPRAGLAAVLGTAYIVPVLFQATLGTFDPAQQLVWIGALFGVSVGLAPRARWSLPRAWETPLVYWASVVAVTWPIVVWREADFRWAMLNVYHNATSGLGGPPPVVAISIINVALTLLVGIVFFDACCHAFDAADRRRFESYVVWPLAASVLISAVLAIYQGTVDLTFLSAHNWPADHRAAGGLIDAGGSGSASAFWCVALFVLAGRWTAIRMGAATVGAAVLVAGTWMTGSRSAAAAAIIALVGMFAAAAARGRRRLVLGAAVVAVALAGVALAVIVARGSETVGPVGRAVAIYREAAAREGTAAFIREQLFDRGAPVGTMSVQMVAAYPVTGVGVGAFYDLMSDYAWKIIRFRSTPDNAQSWYRHQLAELGWLGSLGWLWWTAAAMWLVLRTKGDADDAFAAGAIKAGLVTIAFVSAFAMPTQVPSIALMVWVFMYWYLTACAPARTRAFAAHAAPPWRWPAVAVAVLLFAGATGWVGWTALRPPYRALWADWEYWRGAYDPETGPSGRFWWTGQESAVVKAVQPGYLHFTVSLSHPDVSTAPVRVRLWRQHHEPILDTVIADSAPRDFYLPVPDGARNMMIETWVDRTWRPGGSDHRDLGLAMSDWTFVAAPPAGATVIR
jgi:hypothetical protein